MATFERPKSADGVPLDHVVEARLEILQLQRPVLGKEFGQFRVPGMPVRFASDVQFDAIASGKKHRLAAIEPGAKRQQRGLALLGGKRQALAQVQRRGLVIQSQNEQSPHRSSSLRGQI